MIGAERGTGKDEHHRSICTIIVYFTYPFPIIDVTYARVCVSVLFT